ncbi:MAG: C40 family peptidase [Lachnospiraceae bacterium]|nr:C40 family peptidase [Lachnospiraceae bacterium]
MAGVDSYKKTVTTVSEVEPTVTAAETASSDAVEEIEIAINNYTDEELNAEAEALLESLGMSMEVGAASTGTHNPKLADLDLTAGVDSSKNEVMGTDSISELDFDGDGLIAGYSNLGIAEVENHLNVRQGPGEDYDLVGKMTKHAGCEIIDVSGNWTHIKSGKVDGYVKNEYLIMGSAAIEAAKKYEKLMAEVTTTTLFVREKPTQDSICLTMVPIGEELEVIEGTDKDEWVKIVIDEDEGYVSTQYVKISEQLDKAVTMKELRYGQGVSDVRVNLVNYSKQFLGNPYVWGGTSLTKGCDCSGYVQQIFKKYGYSLPRTSRQQVNCGSKIKASEARPGDLFFYSKAGRINHVAIYIGNGQVINASNPRSGIKISNAYYRTPAAVRRIIKD